MLDSFFLGRTHRREEQTVGLDDALGGLNTEGQVHPLEKSRSGQQEPAGSKRHLTDKQSPCLGPMQGADTWQRQEQLASFFLPKPT